MGIGNSRRQLRKVQEVALVDRQIFDAFRRYGIRLLCPFRLKNRELRLDKNLLLNSHGLQRRFDDQALTNRQLNRPPRVRRKAWGFDSELVRSRLKNEKSV